MCVCVNTLGNKALSDSEFCYSESFILYITLHSLCFLDLMIEMEDHTSDLNEARIPFLDYKNYTNRVFCLASKDGANDVMITGKLDIPESRRATVDQALNQFSNLLNSKTFLLNVRHLTSFSSLQPDEFALLAYLHTTGFDV